MLRNYTIFTSGRKEGPPPSPFTVRLNVMTNPPYFGYGLIKRVNTMEVAANVVNTIRKNCSNCNNSIIIHMMLANTQTSCRNSPCKKCIDSKNDYLYKLTGIFVDFIAN